MPDQWLSESSGVVSDGSDYPSEGNYEPWTAIHAPLGHLVEKHSAGVIFLGVFFSESLQQGR
jgi:hypothetical protein